MKKTNHTHMLDGEPVDPFAVPSYNKTMTPLSSSPSTSTNSPNESLITPLDLNSPIHSSFRDLPDKFKLDYQTFRIQSQQADIKQTASSAIPAIFEAIEFYCIKALSGERNFSRPSLMDDFNDHSNEEEDEKKIEFDVESELNYWLGELDNIYSHLSAHSDIQLQLVNLAISKFESLREYKKGFPRSGSGSPQFFPKIDVDQLQAIGAIIDRQRAIWALRQPQKTCCRCLIL